MWNMYSFFSILHTISISCLKLTIIVDNHTYDWILAVFVDASVASILMELIDQMYYPTYRNTLVS